MTHVITPNPDGATGATLITVDFADEGVNLQGATAIKGGEPEALAYMRVFERDLRRNYAELFPTSPVPTPTEGGLAP